MTTTAATRSRLGSARSCRSASMPSIPGSWTSSSTRSGAEAADLVEALLGRPAPTTAKPWSSRRSHTAVDCARCPPRRPPCAHRPALRSRLLHGPPSPAMTPAPYRRALLQGRCNRIRCPAATRLAHAADMGIRADAHRRPGGSRSASCCCSTWRCWAPTATCSRTRSTTTGVDLQDALVTFRGLQRRRRGEGRGLDVERRRRDDGAPGDGAGTTGGRPRRAAPSTPRGTTPTHERPVAPCGGPSTAARAGRLPAEGVYAYRTSGGESISVLAAHHDYPAVTYAAVHHTGGCGWQIHAAVVKEHVDERTCAAAPGRVATAVADPAGDVLRHHRRRHLHVPPPAVQTAGADAVGCPLAERVRRRQGLAAPASCARRSARGPPSSGG